MNDQKKLSGGTVEHVLATLNNRALEITLNPIAGAHVYIIHYLPLAILMYNDMPHNTNAFQLYPERKVYGSSDIIAFRIHKLLKN